jgi:hypothetical protein
MVADSTDLLGGMGVVPAPHPSPRGAGSDLLGMGPARSAAPSSGDLLGMGVVPAPHPSPRGAGSDLLGMGPARSAAPSSGDLLGPAPSAVAAPSASELLLAAAAAPRPVHAAGMGMLGGLTGLDPGQVGMHAPRAAVKPPPAKPVAPALPAARRVAAAVGAVKPAPTPAAAAPPKGSLDAFDIRSMAAALHLPSGPAAAPAHKPAAPTQQRHAH